MKNKKLIYSLLIVLFAGFLFASDFNNPELEEAAAIKTESTNNFNSDENFDKMMAVLTHKRCVNCHPDDNIPKQGEDSHPHYFGMKRGEDGLGFAATNCHTCHQEENNDFSGVPGAPEWALAPASMKWEGLSRTEIAISMLDPERNGGRSHEEVMKHLTEHKLVLWAWEPGITADGKEREKPPISKEEYIKVVKAWFAAGAVIPAK